MSRFIPVEPEKWAEMVKALAENARLKAEVERLDGLCKQLSRQHSDISCENIMLRKAGEAMYVVIYGFNWLAFNKDITNTLKSWNAAKEGKQS